MTIVKALYNPGARPFVSTPTVRFDAGAKLGDPGVTYEFNVKIQKLDCKCSDLVWAEEVEIAREAFGDWLHRHGWAGPPYFTGRSGGWLAVDDKTGRMTAARLTAITKEAKS